MIPAAHTGPTLIPALVYSAPAASGTARTLYTQAHIKFTLTLRKTKLASCVSVIRLFKFDDTRMNLADVMFTSVALFIDMPTDDIESAGASFMPSPTRAIVARDLVAVGEARIEEDEG